MEKVFVIVILVTFLASNVTGFYIKSDHRDQPAVEDKFADLTNSWIKYLRKMYPNMKAEDHKPYKDRFNELEVLHMIPMVIDLYRAEEINKDDENVLKEIYGSLWEMIVQEAERKPHEKMDGILESLFESFYLTKDLTDIKPKINVNSAKKPIKPTSKMFLPIKSDDHPSQRVLNTAAMLIHQVVNNKEEEKEEEVPIQAEAELDPSEDNPTISLQLFNIPIKKIKKRKRNVNIHLKGSGHSEGVIKIYGGRSNDSGDESDDDYDYDTKAGEYMYGEDYEDDAGLDLLRSNYEYGDIRDLIILDLKHRLRREKEETKLTKKHFFSLKN